MTRGGMKREQRLEVGNSAMGAIPDDVVQDLGQPDARGMMDALMAIGATFPDALAQVEATLGTEGLGPLKGHFEAYLQTCPKSLDAVALLRKMGEVAPETAHAWLDGGLAKGLFVAQGNGPDAAKKTLDLSEIPWITSLPANLKITGTLNLSKCENLKALPEGMKVGQKLIAHQCKTLTDVPASLAVKSTLDLSYCTSLKALPDGFKTRNDINLNGCDALEYLPQEWKVTRDLSLSYCKSLEGLPVGLKVGGDLELSDCQQLSRLPDGLEVGNDLRMFRCSSLTHLPADIRVGGSLQLPYCSQLADLPDNLHFNKNLNLEGCSSLKTLPPSLDVNGELNLKACRAWDGRLGANVWVGEEILTDEHYSGITFQEWRKTHPFDYVNMDDVMDWASRTDRPSLNDHFHVQQPERLAATFVTMLEARFGCSFADLQTLVRDHHPKGDGKAGR